MNTKNKATPKSSLKSQNDSNTTANELELIFSHVNREYIPKKSSPAYKVLSILADGKEHRKIDLLQAIGDDPRSPLQRLRNESYGFWLIHNLSDHKGIYQLDEAHLNGVTGIDALARNKARYELKSRSRIQAEKEAHRLNNAITQEIKARQLLVESKESVA